MNLIKISRTAFEHNTKTIKENSQKKIIAIVKANAYGHGIEQIAQLAEINKNIAMIATNSLSEAIYLRSINIKKKILVLADIDQDIKLAKLHNISLSIYNLKDLEVAISYKIKFHLKFNTGLNRLGFNTENLKEIVKILEINNENPEGIFSHFAESDAEDDSYIKKQINLFDKIVIYLKKNDINFEYIHIANSTASLRKIDSIYSNTIRCGGLLLGLIKEKFINFLEVKPVLNLESRIIQIRNINAGESVGYGRTFIAKKNMVIAIVSIGYVDGIPPKLSGNGYFFIDNQKTKIIGKMCMNMTIVDVTDMSVKLNSKVIIINNKINLNKIAIITGQPVYYLATQLNSKIDRVIDEDKDKCYYIKKPSK